MKKTVMTVVLGMLLIGVFGAAAVSAVASDDVNTNYGHGFGHMHRWTARYTDSGYIAGNFTSCPYFNSNGDVELKVGTVDEALKIARAEIDDNVSKEDISQMGRWWIVSYKDDEGVSSQARIDAVTGEVFTGYSVPAGPQGRGMCGRGPGFCRANGY
jgi:hypothetical protein